jgi:copper/silver efflux system protein
MVARIIEACARHRFLVFIAVGIAVVMAWMSIQRTKVDAIPDLGDPQVIVFTEWMGQSPTLIEDQVTYPIISALVSTPRVADVRGLSMFGMSFVYVLFDDGTDLDWARSRVAERMQTIAGGLPDGVTPRLGPDATGIGWVFQYVVVDDSGRLTAPELRELQDYDLKLAIGAVDGVAEVATIGGYQKEYQVTVDPDRLRSHGVTLHDVSRAIADSTGEVGGRVIEMAGREYYVRGRGYVASEQDVAQIVVSPHGMTGTAVTIADVGRVTIGPAQRRGALDWNGEGEAVGGIVVMRHGENALEVIRRVEARIAALEETLPDGVRIEVAYDRSQLIERSIDTLTRALIEEGIAVALVILIFLLHVRSAMVPILSLPIAVALAFIPMYLLGIPSTIMSLGGIAIALGAAVDAEIVMVEACHKKLEHAPPGADRSRLLAEAAREVTPAIFYSLLIVAVGFLPVFALEGQAARMFQPLAYTKTFVMLAAALLSITLAPALRDLALRGKLRPESRHPISRGIIAVYKPFVYVALRRPWTTALIGALAVASAAPLATRLGSEFMPPLDEGDILYMPMTLSGVSIDQARDQLQRQDRVLRTFPEVESVFGKVGRAETATDPAPLAMVETTIRLRPRAQWRTKQTDRWWSGWAPDLLARPLRALWPDERPITWNELTAEMNTKMQFAGWTNAWTYPIKTRLDMLTTGIRTPVGIKILGEGIADLEEIERIGLELEELLRAVPGTRSAVYERGLGGLYIDVVPRRDQLARYGLTVGDVSRVVEMAIGGATVATTIEGRNRVSINVRFPQDLRADVETLRQLPVPVMGRRGMIAPDRPERYAQMDMGGGGPRRGGDPARPRLPEPPIATDAPMAPMAPGMGGPMTPMTPMTPGMPGDPATTTFGRYLAPGAAWVPLGELAEIAVTEGPPMVRNEDGRIAGYVYIDVDDDARDIGGWIGDAVRRVADARAGGELRVPDGFELRWSGQYEQLRQMRAQMKLAVPAALLLIVFLLWLQFRSLAEAAIVLLSIPFALVGSVWILWLLDYRMSTAVWVGVIALIGLAAQTGVVMILYIDNAFFRRKRAGQIRNLDDIIAAHLEGTVLRVRPKLMTVTTMLVGLVPLLWADGSGADVMKRIAAPMVGGLITSAILTLELLPVIYTYWRWDQLLLDELAAIDPRRRRRLLVLARAAAAQAVVAGAALVAPLYVEVPRAWSVGVAIGAAIAGVALLALSMIERRPARLLVWPPHAAPPA